jgi:L-alanine-DL-glutamate epimerase-like enolase superfamily enzyme
METTRREFIGGLAACAAAAGVTAAGATAGARGEPASKAVDPSLFRDGGPGSIDGLLAHIEEARKKTGLKIRSIESFIGEPSLGFVRIRTDDGSEGWGQLSPFDADITATVLHRKVAPLVLGADPADFDAISDRVIEENYKYPWSFICRALAGVDTAIWDLLGKRAGKNVCALLGGKPRPLPVYGSSMSRTIKPADEAARLARLRDELGFGAFKVRIGKVNGHDADQWPGRTEELIPAVRKAIGGGVRLLADGNSCYSPRRAIEVGRILEANACSHFEEPCPYWELEQTAEVAATLTVPVAGGEQDNDLAQWRRMIRMDAVDIAQPDVCYIGGLTRALRVVVEARRAGKPCVPHSANPSWVTVFALHLMGAIPNAGPHIEFSIERTAWTEGVYDPPLRVVGGKVAVPDGPGWGVTLRREWIEKASRRGSPT